MLTLLRVTGGRVSFLNVNVMWLHFSEFTFNLHSFNYCLIVRRCCCNILCAIFGFSCVAINVVSSAKVHIEVPLVVWISAVYSVYNTFSFFIREKILIDTPPLWEAAE